MQSPKQWLSSVGRSRLQPLPPPGIRIAEGRNGRWAFKRKKQGLVKGQVPYGYACFHDEDEYLAFLRVNYVT